MGPPGRDQPLFLVFLFILLHIVTSYGAPSSYEDSLLELKESLTDDSGALSSWSSSKSPCFGNENNWAGIICSKAGSIWGLRLENMGLSGTIDVDALTELPRLRSISFMNNSLGGPLPDFRKLRSLKTIFLSYNNFEGPIAPDAFDGMKRLRKIHLNNNKFSGEIPKSLASLSKLVELRLDGNQFQGPIPDLKLNKSLQEFNVSNNQLEGPLPANLAQYDASAFSGNKELCGPPLDTCAPTSTQNIETSPPEQAQAPAPAPSTIAKPFPIIVIVLGVALAMVLAIVVIVMVLHNKCDKNQDGSAHASDVPRKGAANDVEHGVDASPLSSNSLVAQSKGDNGKLTFIKEDRERFDLPDLLKASAEILGSGCFGSSYKAILNNGSSVVVKRFKKMNNVKREEFQEHMRRLGRLAHPNLLPLVAYYYRKEEKLFITEPIEKGSLAVLLHGQTRGKPTLDWPTRLKVIKGVAKGLAYLYKELPSLIAPHGHLKSSNVLLRDSFEPVLSDYGLIPLINQESVQEMMVVYKSPEYYHNGRVTKKTDVWALGILIMETMTGKFPATYLQQGSDVDMTNWVQTVVDEGFDKNMGQTKNSDGEMQKLLKIGMACCESDIEKRLDIKEACERIEEVRERDNDDDFYSTSASTEADARSSRGMSEDFTVNLN